MWRRMRETSVVRAGLQFSIVKPEGSSSVRWDAVLVPVVMFEKGIVLEVLESSVVASTEPLEGLAGEEKSPVGTMYDWQGRKNANKSVKTLKSSSSGLLRSSSAILACFGPFPIHCLDDAAS